jgi:Asp-tRNA(Asn)/Glu-tRNA(Gln) amidotransferase A subunit family amidase
VGFKPTFGRIPQTERGALLNCVGVLTKTVRDSALHLTVAAGPDDSDRFSLPPAGISYAAAIQSPRPGGLRAAFSADLGYLPVDTELASAVEAAAQTLIGAAQMRSVPTKVALPNMYLTYCIFALSELRERMKSDFNGRAGQLCPRLQFAMTLAEQFSTQHFYQAQVDTMKAEAAIAALFADVDVLITPVTLIPPHLADEPTPDNVGCVSLFELGVENFPMWANFGGCPSISVPVGFTKSGLPIGMLITGRRFADDIVLSIARVWEQIRPWRLEAPRSARDN